MKAKRSSEIDGMNWMVPGTIQFIPSSLFQETSSSPLGRMWLMENLCLWTIYK